MTNYDYIKNTSLEEMACMLCFLSNCKYCVIRNCCDHSFTWVLDANNIKNNGYYNWLQKERG